jgi:hypothetical protein
VLEQAERLQGRRTAFDVVVVNHDLAKNLRGSKVLEKVPPARLFTSGIAAR